MWESTNQWCIADEPSAILLNEMISKHLEALRSFEAAIEDKWRNEVDRLPREKAKHLTHKYSGRLD